MLDLLTALMAADGSPIRIGVVPGTTRPGNKSHAISDWVLSLAKQLAGPSVSYELVDLQDYNLPLLDEPGVPAKDEPTQQHTRVWQARVKALHGFVFVTAQYNWGIPAVLKNALDFLYKEWTGKPAAIISYGGHGGGKAAGQLTQVALCLTAVLDIEHASADMFGHRSWRG